MPPDRRRQILEVGLRLERHFGAPRDVDWAWAENASLVVQSRPITMMQGTGREPATMRRVKPVGLLLIAALLALAGCGDDEPDESGSERVEGGLSLPLTTTTPAAAAPRRKGTTNVVRGSEFGRMLWGPKRQAIYAFERDRRGESRCYGECAEAWPPVYTRGKPRAGGGVKASLLGTTRRRDGRRQVTYAGRPLYYYAHEGPDEVRCHNVDLNGGLWWVVGPNGRPRP
jgi:predicted lipoprotein with Yx(FWY)xxD motif